MAYCTQGDIQISVGGATKLAQLSDLDNVLSGAVNVAAVAAAIDEASAEMASYIGHRISINAIQASIPRVVVNKAAAWAARILRRNAYNGQPLEDDIEQKKMDIEWLTGVAEGKISLGVEPAPKDAPEIIDKAAPRDSTLQVSRRALRGFA